MTRQQLPVYFENSRKLESARTNTKMKLFFLCKKHNCCALLLQSATKLSYVFGYRNRPHRHCCCTKQMHTHHNFALAFSHAAPQIIGLAHAKPSLKRKPSSHVVQKKQRKSQRLVFSCCLTFISVCVCICLFAFLALQTCTKTVCSSAAIACATSSQRANSRRLALRFGLSGLCFRGCSSTAVRAGQKEETAGPFPIF